MKKLLQIFTKIFLTLIMIFSGLALTEFDVNANTRKIEQDPLNGLLVKQDEFQFFEPNPLLICDAQLYKDVISEDIDKINNEIFNQSIVATTNGLGNNVINGLKCGTNGFNANNGSMGMFNRSTWATGVSFSFISATSYSFVALDNYNANSTITVNYPLVGTYDGKKVGCKVVVSDIVYKRAIALNTCYGNNMMSELQVPYFIFTNNLYNGFMNYNVENCKLTYNFYDYSTKQDISLDKGVSMSVNSLNGYNEWALQIGLNANDVYEFAASNNCKSAVVLPVNNLIRINDARWKMKIAGENNDFDDYIRGKTFNRNSVTFEYGKSANPSIVIGTNGSYSNGEEQNSIWATVISGVLTYGRPDEPIKTVSKSDVYANEDMTYTISQKINNVGVDCITSYYKDFSLSDYLPDDFVYESLKVIDENGNKDISLKGITNYNNVTRELTWQANSDFLKDELQLKGQNIRFEIKGKADNDLTDEKLMKNKATTRFNITASSGGEVLETNEVETKEHVATLLVEKISDKNHYTFGEIGHYTISAKCNGINDNDEARNVVIKDTLENSKASIIKNSIKVFDNNSKDITKEVKINYVDGQNYEITTNKTLKYNEKITISYDVKFTSESDINDKVQNTATGSSDTTKPDDDDNIVDIDAKPINPVKSVSVKDVYANDEIIYTIEQKLNISSLKYTDFSMSDFMPDDFVYGGLKVIDKSSGTDITGKGITKYNTTTRELTWEASSDYLRGLVLDGQTISFVINGKAAKKLSDEALIKNRATTKFNVTTISGGVTLQSNEVITEEHVAILDIVKTSDKDLYNVKETGHYTLTVGCSGASDDDEARNVVINDKFTNTKAQLQTETIKVSDYRGYDITPQVKINATLSGFTINTNKTLKYGQNFVVTYDVYFMDTLNNGDALKNIAKATSDNSDETDTDNEVIISGYRNITITKKILADDTWFAHGNPTFIIKLEGKLTNGKTITYAKSITFTKNDLITKDEQGYIYKKATFDKLLTGTYSGYEIKVSRYKFGGIENISSNATINNQKVIFDMINSNSGKATIFNQHTRYDKYSHNDIKVNKFYQ